MAFGVGGYEEAGEEEDSPEEGGCARVEMREGRGDGVRLECAEEDSLEQLHAECSWWR